MIKKWLFISSFSLLALSNTLFSAESLGSKTTDDLIFELIYNTRDITEALNSIDFPRSPCYKKCDFGFLLGKCAAASFQLFAMRSVLEHTFRGLYKFSQWATDCQPGNPNSCENLDLVFHTSMVLSGVCLTACVGLPCSWWISRQVEQTYDNAANKRMQKAQEQAPRIIKSQLDAQRLILRELLSRPLNQLEVEVRKVIFLYGAKIGNVRLMRSVLTDSEQKTLQQLKTLDSEICSICQNNLFSDGVGLEIEQINDCTILTDCKHSFHERCLRAWLKSRSICPNCTKKNPEYKHIFELWTLP